jgi:hypothetical protein
MSTGDPMRTCPFCGNIFYANTRLVCGCLGEQIHLSQHNKFMDIDPMPPRNPMSCPMCGCLMVSIRGKYPDFTKERIVCPTCLADIVGEIHKMTDPDYSKVYENKK